MCTSQIAAQKCQRALRLESVTYKTFPYKKLPSRVPTCHPFICKQRLYAHSIIIYHEAECLYFSAVQPV